MHAETNSCSIANCVTVFHQSRVLSAASKATRIREQGVDVADWLQALGFGEYASSFVENRIDAAVLCRIEV